MHTEAEGIKAIIDLQALAGNIETEDEACAGWRSMSDFEKDQTMRVHNYFVKQADEHTN